MMKWLVYELKYGRLKMYIFNLAYTSLLLNMSIFNIAYTSLLLYMSKFNIASTSFYY